MNRAERRRYAKEQFKTGKRPISPSPDGISSEALQEAETELRASSSEVVRSVRPEVMFAALVDSWHVTEAQRAELHAAYDRTIDLRKQGRPLDADPLVKQYALVRQEQDLIVDQMIEVLLSLDARTIEQYLTGRHVLAHKNYVQLLVPMEIAAELREEVAQQRNKEVESLIEMKSIDSGEHNDGQR